MYVPVHAGVPREGRAAEEHVAETVAATEHAGACLLAVLSSDGNAVGADNLDAHIWWLFVRPGYLLGQACFLFGDCSVHAAVEGLGWQ